MFCKICASASLWYKRSCCSADRLNEAVASRVSAEPETRAAMSLGGGFSRGFVDFSWAFMGNSMEKSWEILWDFYGSLKLQSFDWELYSLVI